jgi:hypothetical protein
MYPGSIAEFSNMRYLLAIIFISITLPAQLSAAPAAEAFGTLPNVYDAAISPDGKQIAMIMNIRGDYGVRVITLGATDEKLRAVLLGEGVKPEWIRWANTGRVLVGLWQSEKVQAVPITMNFIYTRPPRIKPERYTRINLAVTCGAATRQKPAANQGFAVRVFHPLLYTAKRLPGLAQRCGQPAPDQTVDDWLVPEP